MLKLEEITLLILIQVKLILYTSRVDVISDIHIILHYTKNAYISDIILLWFNLQRDCKCKNTLQFFLKEI